LDRRATIDGAGGRRAYSAAGIVSGPLTAPPRPPRPAALSGPPPAAQSTPSRVALPLETLRAPTPRAVPWPRRGPRGCAPRSGPPPPQQDDPARSALGGDVDAVLWPELPGPGQDQVGQHGAPQQHGGPAARARYSGRCGGHGDSLPAWGTALKSSTRSGDG